MADPVLTPQDMAERYGKSVSTIYRMNCYTPEKLPPSFHIGNSVRWRLSAVEQWEKENETNTSKADRKGVVA